MIYFLTYGANAAAFAGICRWGGIWERVAVGVLVLSILADPFLSGFDIGTWRAGVALPNALLLAGLWLAAHRADRWWLIGVAAVQLVIVGTHLLPLLTSVHLVWSGFALRRMLYLIMSAIFVAGVAEILLDRRYRARAHQGS